jgi:hypothetical protein
MIRRLRAGALALALLSVAGPPALAATPDPFLDGRPWDQGQVLTWRWGTGGAPPAAMRDAIRAALDDAMTTDRSRAPTFVQDSAATSTIAYGVEAPCGLNGLACFRRSVPDDAADGWFQVHLRENGHRFDWGTLRWCEMSGRPNGCYDAENITLDELGHVFGLDHHVNLPDDSDYGDAVVQTYSRVKPQDFYNAHAFGRCDVATLQLYYDVASASTLYSTCLDVPTTLDLVPSRTWTLAGGSVHFLATLRTAGTRKLDDNLVSGRSVVLQVRTTSGWADLVTMAPGTSPGTYTATLVMRTTAELRAQFRRPTTEGLRGSLSGSFTVTVGTACTTAPCPLSIADMGR